MLLYYHLFFRMKLIEAFCFVSVISKVQAENVGRQFFSRTEGHVIPQELNIKAGPEGTPYGIGLFSPPGTATLPRTAYVTSGTGGVQPNLGNRSIRTELLKTDLDRLLQFQHGGGRQDQPSEGDHIYLAHFPKVRACLLFSTEIEIRQRGFLFIILGQVRLY